MTRPTPFDLARYAEQVFCPPAAQSKQCKAQGCTGEAHITDFCRDCERERGPFCERDDGDG